MSTASFLIQIIMLFVQIFFIFTRRKMGSALSYVFVISALLLFGEIILRSVEIGFVAVTGMFEALILFSSLINLMIFSYMQWQKDNAALQIIFGSTFISIVFLALASSPIAPKDILHPIPALRSNWLMLHVSFTFIGEAFFTLSFFSGILFLLNKDEEKRNNLDKLTYTFIGIGYPVYTAGAIIFGSIWAYYAWGNYWSWDPKETWSLITWLIYTLYLHMRIIRKKKGTVPALLSVAGYIATMFTFFGVNYFLSGLHSYT
jgi:ABC-type transport system involved in cytochrome c biogenesis permease subunit